MIRSTWCFSRASSRRTSNWQTRPRRWRRPASASRRAGRFRTRTRIIRRVETVHEIRGQCAKQRELMDQYKSITEDVLRELQEKLRGASELAEAVAWKELADAEVERLAAETEAKHAEAFAYRVEADDVAAEQRARGEARLLAKMARDAKNRRSSKNRDGGREGDGGGASRGRESSVASRMAAARARAAKRTERTAGRWAGRAGTVATWDSRGRTTRRWRGRGARGGRCRCSTG